MTHTIPIAVGFAAILALLPLACEHKVTVGKYEEKGPSTTVHGNGSVTTTTGSRTFKLVEVKRQK